MAEVFLTAGHAFQRLGDLTMHLHGECEESLESKWAEQDVERFRDALTRYGILQYARYYGILPCYTLRVTRERDYDEWKGSREGE